MNSPYVDLDLKKLALNLAPKSRISRTATLNPSTAASHTVPLSASEMIKEAEIIYEWLKKETVG